MPRRSQASSSTQNPNLDVGAPKNAANQPSLHYDARLGVEPEICRIIRIHDECLVLQVYKAMHKSPHDSKTCVKMEEVDQVNHAPPAKNPKKKKDQGDKSKQNYVIHSSSSQQTSQVSNCSLVWEIMRHKHVTEGASSKYFDPP
ncbi:hypothetical protein PIB30_086568 [Stylosanthes scabra]|uniref:Uncharacterized protein n=1 Tax=Stylosanthes scabra TaxID=79078 RepID=A0ABU6YSP2_9FABA|nr:hypothetical protein [Stylosanthes scabra]